MFAARHMHVGAALNRDSLALIAFALLLASCTREPVPQIAENEPSPYRPVISNDPPPVVDATPEPPYVPLDGSRGAELFRKCAPCHSIRPDGSNGIGPKLFGVAGRHIAAGEGYRYSDALYARGGFWNDASLDAFLTSPRAFLPGNKMTFRGIENAQDRADLILFLKSQR